MTRRPRRLVLAVAAILPLLFGSAQADIPVQLRFDGQPLEPAAKPDVTCFSSTLDRGVAETERQPRHGPNRDGAGAGGEEAEFR